MLRRPAAARRRFDIYVCTAAEREYALEAWRILDPAALLIPWELRQARPTPCLSAACTILGLEAKPCSDATVCGTANINTSRATNRITRQTMLVLKLKSLTLRASGAHRVRACRTEEDTGRRAWPGRRAAAAAQPAELCHAARGHRRRPPGCARRRLAVISQVQRSESGCDLFKPQVK